MIDWLQPHQGPVEVQQIHVATETLIAVGDLCWIDAESNPNFEILRPASDVPVLASEAEMCRYFARRFAGVALARHRPNSGVESLSVGVRGVFMFPCWSSLEVGGLVRARIPAGRTRLSNNMIAGTIDPFEGIGRSALWRLTATGVFGTIVRTAMVEIAGRTVTGGGPLALMQDQLGFSLPNGLTFGIKTLSELTTVAASAFTNTVIQIPQFAQTIAVSARVTVSVPGAASINIGVSGDTARYSPAAMGATAGSVLRGTRDGIRAYATAAAVRITPNATPSNADGRIRITIVYIEVTPSTS